MTEHLPLDTSPLPVRLRVEDFLLLDESGAFSDYKKTELIGGEILFMNARHRPHMTAKSELAFRIRLALEAIGSGLFVGIEGSLRLSDHDLPEPDILLTSEPYGDGAVPGASVALIVEIADRTLDFDMKRKAALYANANIPEYWVVDINARVINQMWDVRDGRYVERRAMPFGTFLEAATIGELKVPTATL